MKIGILCAMQKEYDLMCDNLYNRHFHADYTTGTIRENGGPQLFVARSGIGKVNAALSTQNLINSGVLEVLSIGVAGAAEETLQAGDIVIGSYCCYHDVWCGKPNKPGQIQGYPDHFDTAYRNRLERYLKYGQNIGGIATGDWFVQTKEEIERIKNYLLPDNNIIAVDMESAAIAQVCHRENIPFTPIRIISDNPLKPKQQEQYDGFWDVLAESSFYTLTKILE